MNTKIQHLVALGTELKKLSIDQDFLWSVESQNPWFIPDFTKLSLESITNNFLQTDKLDAWLGHYAVKEKGSLGIILAGNIPIVGFHDIICSYFCSEKIEIKLSSKDLKLTPHILKLWTDIDPLWKERLSIVDRLGSCEKIIATGSNSAYNYFEQYFGKYKNILRRNRTSVAIVPKDISNEELNFLIDDIFIYFGLGCRNVSKLWIEKGFELSRIFEASERYNSFFNHVKYMNNYDYQRTLLLLNKVPHLSNNFLMLKEDKSLFSPISVLNYESFEDIKEVKSLLAANQQDIQCIVGRDFVPFGQTQQPALSDYADGVDTMNFLLSNE